MLFRVRDREVLAITQPAHAWISGQLARAWGNGEFPAPQPWDEVCLAAELHDIGWVLWEAEPTLNRATGLPHSFLELPLDIHLSLWRWAPELGLSFGRYIALLISLHGTLLYSKRPLSALPAEEALLIRQYLQQQAGLQASLLESLQADPRYAAFATPERVGINQRLMAAWDYISLLVCWGVTEIKRLEEIPSKAGLTSIELSPGDGSIVVSPWPFRDREVCLSLEARRLDRRFDDEASMRKYLSAAPWTRLSILLAPPRGS